LSEPYGIIVDLDLCVGCYACEIACKQENDVPIGIRWIQVFTIGPKKVENELRMDFLPLMTNKCTLCAHRIRMGMEPRCVESCPVKAFTFCKDATELLTGLGNGKRVQVCKLKGDASAFG